MIIIIDNDAFVCIIESSAGDILHAANSSMKEGIYRLSLIRKRVTPFPVQAFHQDSFITVTDQEPLGDWPVFVVGKA